VKLPSMTDTSFTPDLQRILSLRRRKDGVNADRVLRVERCAGSHGVGGMTSVRDQDSSP